MILNEAVELLQKIQAAPEHLEVKTGDLHDALGMAIEALLTERPHGKWEEPFKRRNGRKYHRCNYCYTSSEITLFNNFCPNCGADMREANDET